MAQKAVVCHDGGITASNAPGGGACVTLTLPRTIVTDAAAAAAHD
jgi:signal transduction histidine kinase